MFKVPAIFILSLALAGCAASPSIQSFNSSSQAPRYAWDGAGEDPNQPRHSGAAPSSAARRASPERAKELATLPSDSGGRVRDEAEQEARLSRALVICRGCLRPREGDERLAGLRE
ncbi:MAG: hypothetical protein HY852_09585 [Bradyrhizobium sp.]|uniref:hypothetical protein n=1 Tax=Bradyrhizobium sp. TaxID=376 RepID=UPI0025BFCEF4|nr:hypothetical protein [Bradyrhizobium sp.]MBI5262052.1 hypothetical protein [Bradyrhizobium sp.]